MSERTADRQLATIYDECQRLADMPGMGHHREELLSYDFRFWTAGNYTIVYRWQVRPIQVVAVLHSARDLRRVLTRRPID